LPSSLNTYCHIKHTYSTCDWLKIYTYDDFDSIDTNTIIALSFMKISLID
jgi:hypothetical protein